MARATGMSQTAISRIWRSFGLRPHLQETWKLSTDPQCIDKVRDIVGLYPDPPRSGRWCCRWMRRPGSCPQPHPAHPAGRSRRPARQEHEYVRHGTAVLLAALDVQGGGITATDLDRNTAAKFIEFSTTWTPRFPSAPGPSGAGQRRSHILRGTRWWFVDHPRFHPHYIPSHASWLNQVELFFSILARRLLKRGEFRSVEDLVGR
jgi:hypothetical protein